MTIAVLLVPVWMCCHPSPGADFRYRRRPGFFRWPDTKSRTLKEINALAAHSRTRMPYSAAGASCVVPCRAVPCRAAPCRAVLNKASTGAPIIAAVIVDFYRPLVARRVSRSVS